MLCIYNFFMWKIFYRIKWCNRQKIYVFIHIYTNYIKAEQLEIENALRDSQFLNFVLLTCVESLEVVPHLYILGLLFFYKSET